MFPHRTGAELVPIVKIDGSRDRIRQARPLTKQLVGKYHALTKCPENSFTETEGSRNRGEACNVDAAAERHPRRAAGGILPHSEWTGVDSVRQPGPSTAPRGVLPMISQGRKFFFQNCLCDLIVGNHNEFLIG